MSVALRMDLSYSQMYAAVIFYKNKQTNKQTNKQKRQNTGI